LPGLEDRLVISHFHTSLGSTSASRLSLKTITHKCGTIARCNRDPLAPTQRMPNFGSETTSSGAPAMNRQSRVIRRPAFVVTSQFGLFLVSRPGRW
jgi:hypothetical protein